MMLKSKQMIVVYFKNQKQPHFQGDLSIFSIAHSTLSDLVNTAIFKM